MRRTRKDTIQNITGLLAEKNINILGSVINDGASTVSSA